MDRVTILSEIGENTARYLLIICMTADNLCGHWFSNQFLPYNLMAIGVREIFNSKKYACWYANKQRFLNFVLCQILVKNWRISNCAGFELSCTPSVLVWCCLKILMVFLAGQLHTVLRVFKIKMGQFGDVTKILGVFHMMHFGLVFAAW